MRRRSLSPTRHGHYYKPLDSILAAVASRANWAWKRGATRGQVTALFVLPDKRP